MITGYNTDIEFDGVTYHIQTEDKGPRTPVIVSLIYDGGTILASKRVPYDDLLVGGLNERALAARLQKLHKTICAAIKKGRITDLRRMAGRSERSEIESADNVLEVHENSSISGGVVEHGAGTAEAGDKFRSEAAEQTQQAGAGQLQEPLIEAVAVSDEEQIIPHEAVTIVSDLAGKDRPANTKLSVDLIGDAEFFGGQERVVGVMVCRGSDRKVVPNAEVMIKVVGSSFRPLVYHSLTDMNGISMVSVNIPHFRSGRASMMVRAMNKGEEVELRRAVVHG